MRYNSAKVTSYPLDIKFSCLIFIGQRMTFNRHLKSFSFTAIMCCHTWGIKHCASSVRPSVWCLSCITPVFFAMMLARKHFAKRPKRCQKCPKATKQNLVAQFLPQCMACRRGLAMRILSVRQSVRLSVKRVHCDKMEERYCMKDHLP